MYETHLYNPDEALAKMCIMIIKTNILQITDIYLYLCTSIMSM